MMSLRRLPMETVVPLILDAMRNLPGAPASQDALLSLPDDDAKQWIDRAIVTIESAAAKQPRGCRYAPGSMVRIYKNWLTESTYVVCLLGRTEETNSEIYWGEPEDIDEWLGSEDWNHGTVHRWDGEKWVKE